jgi:hypothetical protein
MPLNGLETSSLPGTCQKVMLTSDPLSMCGQVTSPDTPSAISSPASADGRSLFVSPDGPMIDRFGRGAVRASRSATPVSTTGLMTSAIFGLNFTASSPSITRQSSLEKQVASKAGLSWFDLVSADLESSRYAVGAADLCAACVGAPHVRQRLFFVADAIGPRLEIGECLDRHTDEELASTERSCSTERDFSDAASNRRQTEGEWPTPRQPDGLRELRCGNPQAHWHPEPGILRVADGVSARMGKLRAIGNALVPQVAAEFICAHQGW